MMSYSSDDTPKWQMEVRSFLSSGLTRTEYCKLNDVNSQQLLTWLGRHYEASSNLIPVKVSGQQSITIPPSVLCHAELPNGCKLDIHDASILGQEFTDLIKALSLDNHHVEQDNASAF